MFSSVVKIFDTEQCQKIVYEFDSTNLFADDHGYSPNSFGIANLPLANQFVNLLTEKLLEWKPVLRSRQITFKNSFARKYLNGSKLKIHTDRPGLDYTCSVCLESPSNFQWPLKISNVPWDSADWVNSLPNYDRWTSDYTNYYADIGWGIFAEGRKYPHWRDTFPDQYGQQKRAVYVFYHWEEI